MQICKLCLPESGSCASITPHDTIAGVLKTVGVPTSDVGKKSYRGNMATQKKIDTVTELTDRVHRAKSMVFVDYRGLKHKQLESLRKSLKTVNADLTITKNRLMMRALADRAQSAHTALSDTTATLFSYADEVVPLKELLKYFKTAGVGKTKGGLLGQTFLSDTDVTRLAGLPNRLSLLGQLAGQLNAPVQGLHYALSWNINKLVWALNAIKDNKQ